MKRTALLILILLSSSIMTFVVPHVHAENTSHFWALLVSTDPGVAPDTYYMYRILVDRCGFESNNIYYISESYVNPAQNPAYGYVNVTYGNSTDVVRSNITGWLYDHSGVNDTVFIYIAGHGQGYSEADKKIGKCNFNVSEPDEGNEVRESNIYNPYTNTTGWDINQDNDTNDWVGVDESIILSGYPDSSDDRPEIPYCDDELRTDLSCLNYKTLIFVKFGCFSGGLIDDLSGPNRVILTSANETGTSAADTDKNGFNEWTGAFQDALYGEKMNWSGSSLVHTGISVNADSNNDSLVSMWEAWKYAWDNDTNRLSGLETPWLDDDGNGLPTYRNETTYGAPCDNGTLAKNTFLQEVGALETKTRKLSGSEVAGADIWLDGNFCGYSQLTLSVRPGNHTVQVASIFYAGTSAYWFRHWDNNSTNPLRNICVNDSLSICAYYEETDGGGCPYLSVWNGQDFTLDNNLLPSSETSNGSDVNDYYRLEQTLVPHNTNRLFSQYWLQISEFEHEHSHIDQTMLIAVDHAAGTNIAVTPTGEILTYRQPSPPISCVDNLGLDRLGEIRSIDGNLSDMGTFYHGENGSYLIASFGQVTSQDAKLILRADMACESLHPGTSDNQRRMANRSLTYPARPLGHGSRQPHPIHQPRPKPQCKTSLDIPPQHRLHRP